MILFRVHALININHSDPFHFIATKYYHRFEITLQRSFAGSESMPTTAAPGPNPKRTREEKITIAKRTNTL